jgi:hypothetical protein
MLTPQALLVPRRRTSCRHSRPPRPALGFTRRQFTTMIKPLTSARTGKLMALIQVSIDPVVVEALLLGSIATIAVVVGAIALMKAAPQAIGSPTNTEQEILPVLAERLSMTVAARGRMSDPLILSFTLSDPAVTLLRMEIANQLDNGAGTAECVEAAPKIFLAEVEPEVVQRWYNANPYWDGETKQLPIQVFFISGQRAACRTIWVTMCPRKIPSSGLPYVSDFVWFLEGPCSRAIPKLAQMPSRTRSESR